MTIHEKLSGKKILLLSVQTFNYEIIIANKLRQLGAEVDYYDERPANSLFAKGIIRLKRNIYQNKIDNYYKTILKDASQKKYDFLFVIRGEVVPDFFLRDLKKQNPTCFFLFYTWDSFSNHKHPISILKYFDKSFTFDTSDAIKYGINFRPLFFIEQYENLNNGNSIDIKYDVLFIGTAHSDRYIISKKIINTCRSYDLKSFTYYYIHGRLVFLFKKLFDVSFKKFKYKDLRFKSLDTNDILDLYKLSSTILDINHPGQIGLTMRTFEALGAGKKLITTNSEISKYPFYDENNISIINREEPTVRLDFFQSNFNPIDKAIKDTMSINGWINDLFLGDNLNIWENVLKQKTKTFD